MRTPFQILGLKEGATPEQIRKAYHKLVARYHPDRNPGNAKAEAKFIEVQAAYDELTGKKDRTDNGMADVYENVGSLFTSTLVSICKMGQDPANIDIVDVMVRSIEERKRILRNGIKNHEQALKPLRKMLGRLKVKSGDNVYEHVLVKHICEAEEMITKIQTELNMVDKVEAYVKNTSFEQDGVEPNRRFFVIGSA